MPSRTSMQTSTGSSRLPVPEPSLGCAAAARRPSSGPRAACRSCGDDRPPPTSSPGWSSASWASTARSWPASSPTGSSCSILPLVVVGVALSGYSTSTTDEVSSHLKLGSTLAKDDRRRRQGGRGRPSRPPRHRPVRARRSPPGGCSAGCSTCRPRCGSCALVASLARPGPSCGCSAACCCSECVLYVAAVVRNAGFVAGLAGGLTTLASTFVAFFGLGWILPRRSREWFWLLPGAALGALAQLGLQTARHLLPGPAASPTPPRPTGPSGITVAALSYLFLVGVIVVVSLAVERRRLGALRGRSTRPVPGASPTGSRSRRRPSASATWPRETTVEVLGPLGPMAGPDAPER